MVNVPSAATRRRWRKQKVVFASRPRGQWSPGRRRVSRRDGEASVERMSRADLLPQVDGSRHDWLEGRGPWLTLVGAIDDATDAGDTLRPAIAH
jgi:hypothetical protein